MQGEQQNEPKETPAVESEKPAEEKKAAQNYRIDLTTKELAALTKKLPSGYSLQFQSKIQKRSSTAVVKGSTKTSISKKKSIDSKLQNQVLFENIPLQNDQLQPDLNRMPSVRSKKSQNAKYNDQYNDATYAKYNTGYSPVESGRRNGYEMLDETLKPCVRILNMLKNNKTSWPFREPVDVVALGIPHYLDIIKEPMDLSKIQQNLRTGQYATPTQFHADINKIVRNSQTFNQGNIQFLQITKDFENYYFKIIAEPNYEQKPATINSSNTQPTTKSIQKTANYSNISPAPAKPQKKKPERPQYSDTISLTEKKELSINIRKLAREHMKGIVDIVRQEGDSKIKDEFDLEDLKPETIRQLQSYVRSKLMEPTNKGPEVAGNQNKANDSEEFEIESEEDS